MSALDKGTGKEANITITASTNLSDDEVDKAVKEAEKFAEEDKKRKEKIEVANNADQTIYQLEKTLSEIGDKATEDEKKAVQDKLDELKKVKDGEDVEAIKAAIEAANQAFYPIAAKMYQQDPTAAGMDPNAAGAQQSAPHDDNVVDADFKVDEDK